MKESTINIKVQVDENNVPENLEWTAEAGGISQQKTHALFLSVWDKENQEALRIDLWDKEMPMDDMKKFIHQTLHTLAVTYERATSEEDVAQDIAQFAEVYAQKAGIKM